MVKHTLTKKERVICKKVVHQLVAVGLYFAGLDVINGKLIEVNVCSPGGITRINKLNRTRLQVKILDFVEKVIRSKEDAVKRKYELRQKVLDAKNSD